MLLELLVFSSATAVGSSLTRRRRTRAVKTGYLIRSRESYSGGSKSQRLDLADALVERLRRLDDGYQTFVARRLDPLIGGDRAAEVKVGHTKEGLRLQTDEEKAVNRICLSSVVTMGTGLIGKLIYPPVLIISAGLIVYSSFFFIRRAIVDVFRHREVTGNVLASLESLGIIVGRFFVIGGMFTLLMALGEKLVLAAKDRSVKRLVSVFKEPESVYVLVDGVEIETPYEKLRKGDELLVRAGQIVPVDGVVLEGVASIDQQVLSGEAQPVEIEKGDRVFASTLALAGEIRVRVECSGENSIAEQVGSILNKTAGYELGIKTKSERLSEKAALPTLLLGVLAWPVSGFASMIAVWGSCIGFNMRVTGPIAMLNYLNSASRRGILVKDGRSLERLHQIDIVLFDKTGTLTLEQPHLARIHTFGSIHEEQILRLAAAAECYQTHPIARAILMEARARGLDLPVIGEAHYEVGYGIKVKIENQSVRVGSERYLQLEGVSIPDEISKLQAELQGNGHSCVMVAVEGRLEGAIELKPTLRPEATEVVEELHQLGVATVIISGDQPEPTRLLAKELGVDRYFAETLPGCKAAYVEQLQAEGKTVCFVGDGINDAIALKKADVSVSLRGATTAATDTAQIVLMEESLRQLPSLLGLGRSFDSNLKSGYACSIAPGVTLIGGALLLHWGLAASLAIWTTSFAVNMGIALQTPTSPRLGEKCRGH